MKALYRFYLIPAIAFCSVSIQAAEQDQAKKPQSPASKQGATSPQPGMVAVKDAETGQIRQATAEEIGALVNTGGSANQAARALSTESTVVQMPNGYSTVRLGPDQMSFSVMTKTADGKLVESCITGEAAAKDAVVGLKQPAKAKEKLDDK